MSVPIAVVGWMPKMRISSGVISEPPPMPVMPTSTPTPKPKKMSARSIWVSAKRLIDFPDLLGQERGLRQDTSVAAETKQFAAAAPSPSTNRAVSVSMRELTHSYGDLRAIGQLDLEVPAHGVLGLVG